MPAATAERGLPRFLLDPGRLLGSMEYASLTHEERGVFLDLLLFAWQDDDCGIVPDRDRLARVLRLERKRADATLDAVLALFAEHPDAEGKVCVPWQLEDWHRAREVQEKRGRAGKASGKARRRADEQVEEPEAARPREGEHVLNTCSTHVEPLQGRAGQGITEPPNSVSGEGYRRAGQAARIEGSPCPGTEAPPHHAPPPPRPVPRPLVGGDHVGEGEGFPPPPRPAPHPTQSCPAEVAEVAGDAPPPRPEGRSGVRGDAWEGDEDSGGGAPACPAPRESDLDEEGPRAPRDPARPPDDVDPSAWRWACELADQIEAAPTWDLQIDAQVRGAGEVLRAKAICFAAEYFDGRARGDGRAFVEGVLRGLLHHWQNDPQLQAVLVALQFYADGLYPGNGKRPVTGGGLESSPSRIDQAAKRLRDKWGVMNLIRPTTNWTMRRGGAELRKADFVGAANGKLNGAHRGH